MLALANQAYYFEITIRQKRLVSNRWHHLRCLRFSGTKACLTNYPEQKNPACYAQAG